MPKVNYVRPEVVKLLPQWRLIRDCVEGEFAIKAGKELYLPRPDPEDVSTAATKRYKAYLQRAIFYNVTGRTLRGMVGHVFMKDPSVELNSLLKPFIENVDGAGVTLDQQAKDALDMVLAEGRCGLLVDYPTTDAPATRADVLQGRIRPSIVLYQPGSIINWRVGTTGGEVRLTLVVLEESYQEAADDDGFVAKEKTRWRVLRLSPEGNYTVELWKKKDGGDGEEFEQIGTTATPVDSAGKAFKEIPFQFIGWKNNDADCDPPPLLDLAILNVGHYRNSADNEENSFVHGQATLVVTGVTQQWVKDNGAIRVGARGGIPLPAGADAKLLQVSENGLPKANMEHKEKQMVAIGAKLVEAKEVQQTATEAGHRNAEKESILSSSTKNVSSAYNQALRWGGMFVGTGELSPEQVVYELNDDFEFSTMSAQDMQGIVAAWQSGAIDFEELRWNLKRSNRAFKDDEEVRIANEEAIPDGEPAQQQQQQEPPADE